MGIERGSLKGFRGGWSVPPKPCDSCKVAAAAVFCRSDSAFLCVACDDKIHCANNKLMFSRHERVWVCEVCEQAPASVTCKADAAALCITCDSDIHSANPLARRHERVPIEPFFDSAAKASAAAFNFAVPSSIENVIGLNGYDDAEAAVSWLHPNLNVNFGSNITDATDMKSGEMFFAEMHPFLDFEYSNSFQNNNHGAGNDSVVPVQSKTALTPVMNHHSEACFDIDFCRSKLSSFNKYPAHSLSQSVSSSSLDVGVVPDANTVSDISDPFGHNMSNSSDSSVMVSAGNSAASQMCGMDREARVLRYREKRKNRKFEKTIRYASRKAYAETRPRIKGRFAKRTGIESQVDRICGPAGTAVYMVDTQYGAVPTF